MNQKFLAAALGNWLEWYDFGVYAAVPKILGAHFFPTHDPSVQIMQSFMAFAAGYVTRPLGGILIGVIGDRIGRKCALWTSMLLMSLLLQLTVWQFFFLMFLHLICFFDRRAFQKMPCEDVSNLSHWMFANLCPLWLALYGHVGSSPIVTRYCNWRGICKCFGVQHGTRSWQQKNHIWSSDAIWMQYIPGFIFVPNRLPHLLNKFSFPSGCKGCLRFGLSVYNS